MRQPSNLPPGCSNDDIERAATSGDEYPPPCTNPKGHVWSSGIDEDTDREIPVRCIYCNADGDA